MPAHTDASPLWVKLKNTLCHLQLSDSICTYSIVIRPSPLSHRCLPLIFVCVELKVHDAPSRGGCFIVLPAEFHFIASCCEMVDARQNTRRAGSQGRKELFISLIFLLCIGRFITLPFLLPERQIEAVWGGRCTVAALLDLTFKWFEMFPLCCDKWHRFIAALSIYGCRLLSPSQKEAPDEMFLEQLFQKLV